MRPNYLTNPFLYSSTNFFNACLSEANNLKLIFQFSCKTSSNLRKLFKQLVVNILVVSCVLALDFSLKNNSHYLFCSIICLRTSIIIHISSPFFDPSTILPYNSSLFALRSGVNFSFSIFQQILEVIQKFSLIIQSSPLQVLFVLFLNSQYLLLPSF